MPTLGPGNLSPAPLRHDQRLGYRKASLALLQRCIWQCLCLSQIRGSQEGSSLQEMNYTRSIDTVSRRAMPEASRMLERFYNANKDDQDGVYSATS